MGQRYSHSFDYSVKESLDSMFIFFCIKVLMIFSIPLILINDPISYYLYISIVRLQRQ